MVAEMCSIRTPAPRPAARIQAAAHPAGVPVEAAVLTRAVVVDSPVAAEAGAVVAARRTPAAAVEAAVVAAATIETRSSLIEFSN